MGEALLPVVAAYQPTARYGTAPFDPPTRYPELGFLPVRADHPDNTAYALIRDSLRCHDASRFGTASWNPFGELIEPGQTVVIKPNLVIHDRTDGYEIRTHPAVIRAILDYTYLALRGRGRIVVCDAPIQGADFSRIARHSGLDRILEFYQNALRFPVALIDLRSEWARIDDESGFICERVSLPGDPLGNTVFDLGEDSAFEHPPSGGRRLAVGDYTEVGISENHQQGIHRYRLSNTILQADVVLNLAKMKTHQKACITGALKNAVGMNTSKDYLPHYRVGAPPEGDEYPASAYNAFVSGAKRRLQEKVPLGVWRGCRRLAELIQGRLARRTGGQLRYGLLGGSWSGNDTIWRTILDINRILVFGSSDGVLDRNSRRRVYHFVDGIVAGEGEGPLKATPKNVGLFLHGADAVAIDVAMAMMMGFEPTAIPLLRQALAEHRYPLTACRQASRAPARLDRALLDRLRTDSHFGFLAPRGWSQLADSVSPQTLNEWLDSACHEAPLKGVEP